MCHPVLPAWAYTRAGLAAVLHFRDPCAGGPQGVRGGAGQRRSLAAGQPRIGVLGKARHPRGQNLRKPSGESVLLIDDVAPRGCHAGVYHARA
jgi:hypothetical protein